MSSCNTKGSKTVSTKEKFFWFNVRVDERKEDEEWSTESKGKLLQFKDKVFHECTIIVISRETSSKTMKLHYHATFKFKKSMLKDTFDKKVNRYFVTYKGNEISRAIVRKPTNNMHYICKDQDVIYCKGLDKEKILAESKDYQEKLNVKKNIINILFELAKDSNSKEEVVEIVFNYYLKKEMMMDYRLMKTRVNTVWARINKQSALSEFMRVCCY